MKIEKRKQTFLYQMHQPLKFKFNPSLTVINCQNYQLTSVVIVVFSYFSGVTSYTLL
jgi:hypothetical protein